MNFTRKDIINKSCRAGLTLLIPSLLITIFNFEVEKSESSSISTDNQYIFKNTLEDYANFLSENKLMPDMLIINEQSDKLFDFVFLLYDSEIHEAPVVMIPKEENYYPDTIDRFKSDVKILHSFARKHGIYIHKDNGLNFECFTGSIRKIRNCGVGNCISEDLYFSVACAYAERFKKMS